MATFRRLKVRDLINLWRAHATYVRHTQIPELFVSFAVIRHFLGLEYLERHFAADAPDDGFFRLTPDRATNIEAARNYRIVDLAELFFNLQHVPGFADCVTRMKTAENPEASYAELHIGRMLYVNNWNFRFIQPRSIRGRDYDFEINYNNNKICADAKCKIEATDLSAKTITSTLSSSRDQLPPDKPGVFFVKVPQHWLETSAGEDTTIKGVEDFFAKGTGRIVSVGLYCEALYFANGVLRQRQGFYEIVNPRRRFGTGFDWKFFKRWTPPAGNPNALPFKWVRFANFPDGMRGHEKD